MQTITSIAALHEAIHALESRRQEQEQELASHFMLIYDGLKPANIIKNIIRDFARSPDVQHQILNVAMRVTSGYLLKKLFNHSQPGLWKQILSAALKFGTTILVRKNSDAIKSGGIHLLHSFLVKHNQRGSR